MTGILAFMFGAGSSAVLSTFGGSVDYTALSGSASASAGLGTTGSTTSSGSPIQNLDTVAGKRWFGPSDPDGSLYWCRATLSSGTAPTSGSGTGTWLQLNVARSWTNSQATLGTRTSNLLIEIATDAGGTNIVGSSSFIITATRE
jgi:hypothetical protein